DIDAPTAFFFSLEKSVVKRKQMLCLRLPEGKVTTEPSEMRKHAVDFYTDLFRADECDVDSAAELLQGLPQLSSEEQNTLSSDLTFDELTAAVSQMALRSRLRGLCLLEMSHSPPVVVSAYADDINIIIQGHTDVQELKESLALYEKASSARVNWGKSEAVLVGQWRVGDIPSLPGGIRWGRRGIKVLGVQLGTEEFQKQNWEGVLDK
ncbi:hypothetical protein JOQ06_005416, partial [Pogonophryne albipinna]